jgi:phage regulator Rha-like protein
MNEIVTLNASLTMTSREIAELVTSQHSHVKISIERLAERGVIDILAPREYLDAAGRGGQTEYLVSKRDSYIVVAQLSPEFTARIVDRWQALEVIVQEQAQKLLQTTQEQLKLANNSANNAQRKVEYMEAEQITRSYLLDSAKLVNVTAVNAGKKNSDKHVKNLNSSVGMLNEEVSTCKSRLQEANDKIEKLTHELFFAKGEARLAKL